MNDTTQEQCPRVEDVSALMDDALPAAARAEAARHVALCPLCGAALRDFEAMRGRMQALREARCDVDLASLIAPLLPQRTPPRPARGQPQRRRDAWQAVPRGLGVAGALAAGIYLGLTLSGGAAVAPRPAAMAVFDTVPPGTLCAGLPVCSPRGR